MKLENWKWRIRLLFLWIIINGFVLLLIKLGSNNSSSLLIGELFLLIPGSIFYFLAEKIPGGIFTLNGIFYFLFGLFLDKIGGPFSPSK